MPVDKDYWLVHTLLLFPNRFIYAQTYTPKNGRICVFFGKKLNSSNGMNEIIIAIKKGMKF